MVRTVIYTDGGCRQGVGGWAVVAILPDGRYLFGYGHQADSTNNRMELQAIIEALETFPKDPLTIVSDSKYVVQGIQEWLPRWIRNDWKAANRKPVKNQDRWHRVAELIESRDIEWLHVFGHRSNRGNNLADRLATKAIQRRTNRPIR